MLVVEFAYGEQSSGPALSVNRSADRRQIWSREEFMTGSGVGDDTQASAVIVIPSFRGPDKS